MNQLDGKRNEIMSVITEGRNLMNKPNAPDFLLREVKRASESWQETNSTALERLQSMKGIIVVHVP